MIRNQMQRWSPGELLNQRQETQVHCTPWWMRLIISRNSTSLHPERVHGKKKKKYYHITWCASRSKRNVYEEKVHYSYIASHILHQLCAFVMRNLISLHYAECECSENSFFVLCLSYHLGTTTCVRHPAFYFPEDENNSRNFQMRREFSLVHFFWNTSERRFRSYWKVM